MLEPRSKGAKPAGENKIGTGRGTLRLRSKGPATVEDEVSFSRGNKMFILNKCPNLHETKALLSGCVLVQGLGRVVNVIPSLGINTLIRVFVLADRI